MRLICTAAFLVLAAITAHAGEADRDRVIFKDGTPPRVCVVITEGVEEFTFQTTRGQGAVSKGKTRTVKEIQYAFMVNPSNYTKGVEARDRGRYEEAAEQFNAQAQGPSEAEQVYGGMAEGLAWEMAGKHAEAAKAFAAAAEKGAAHRLGLDLRYHLGMSLAAAGKKADAEAVVAKLDEDSKGKVGPPAGARAAAIRAALAAAAKDAGKIREHAQKASFRASDEEEVWMHFNLWQADALRAGGRDKDAADLYGRMLPQLTDPAARARVALGRGLVLMASDRQAAIVELIKLDSLPYGSPDQKTEARYHAARLLLEEAEATAKDPAAAKDERRLAFAAENRRTARTLLEAASATSSSHPTKAQAKTLLDGLPKDK